MTDTTASPREFAIDSRPLDVLILAGGLSHEREISVRSGRRVAEALISVGMSAHVRDIDPGLLGYL